jgi:hypothetical protein
MSASTANLSTVEIRCQVGVHPALSPARDAAETKRTSRLQDEGRPALSAKLKLEMSIDWGNGSAVETPVETEMEFNLTT